MDVDQPDRGICTAESTVDVSGLRGGKARLWRCWSRRLWHLGLIMIGIFVFSAEGRNCVLSHES